MGGEIMEDDFLTNEDRDILLQTFKEFRIIPEGFVQFWNWGEVTLDGDFKLSELKALVIAMERMGEKHTAG